MLKWVKHIYMKNMYLHANPYYEWYFYGNTNLFSTLTTQINFEENSFNRGKLSSMQKSKG